MKLRIAFTVCLALSVAALPAAAEIYTVKLSNGTEFETRREPVEAEWDSNLLMVLTDVGNWIGLDKADVVGVEIDTENKGFGKVIDSNTIALGWAPNDAPTGDPEEALDPMSRLLNFLSAEQANQPDYSVQQFVEPGQAGRDTGGLPVGGYTGYGDTRFPVSSGGTSAAEPSEIDQ